MTTTTATMKGLVQDDRGSTEMPAALAGLVIGSIVIASLGTFYADATAAAMDNTTKVDGRTASLRATNLIAKDVGEGRVVEPSDEAELHIEKKTEAGTKVVSYTVDNGVLVRTDGTHVKRLATVTDDALFGYRFDGDTVTLVEIDAGYPTAASTGWFW